MAAEKPPQDKETSELIYWPLFLAEIPPYSERRVIQLSTKYIDRISEDPFWLINTPPIQIHCDSQVCNGIRFFDCKNKGPNVPDNNWSDVFLYYYCRHCKITSKTFAVRVKRVGANPISQAIKMGEMPSFGPPIPARLNEILKTDRELFFKGCRAESQGMGIGAFAYYRRVVENQKNSLFDQFIKVAKRINAPEKMVMMLESAKKETRFTAAVDIIKDAIPETLKINGENPLTLLHRPLSGGLHEWPENECLEEAKNIRIVLTVLCEKVGQALEVQTELDEAVNRLKRPREKK